MGKAPWSLFLSPRSMAIIGVSKREDDYINHYVRTLLEYGYHGRLYLVNPKESEILGFKVYHKVSEIEEAVDLAFIAVPREAVAEVLEECGVKGVKAIIIFTSDSDILSPTGDRGISRAIVEAVKRWKFRVIGPNCLGIYRPSSGLCFAHGFPKEAGNVAFLAQSGGHAAAMGWLGASIGLKFSAIVSYGNAVDVDLPELIEAFGEDPETHVIATYVEGVKDGRQLISSLKKTTAKKPVIVWKGGVTEEGAEAVSTHTLAMAGSWTLWRVALKQGQAIQAYSLEDTAYTSLTFSLIPKISGGRLAVVSISGGEAVSTADACSKHGLSLPRPSGETLKKLEKIVPRYGSSIRNPVDIQLAALDPETYLEILSFLIEDPNIDGLLILQSMEWPSLYRGAQRFHELTDVVCRVKQRYGKPIFVVMQPRLFYEDYQKAGRKLLEVKVPVYPTVDLAVSAISRLVTYSAKRPIA